MSLNDSDADGYELLDFGLGRKLERFGRCVLDRPAPSAEGAIQQQPEMWNTAHARFDGTIGSGVWVPVNLPVAGHPLSLAELTFELKLSPTGHVGLFPEQVENWEWIRQRIQGHPRPVKLLNLFAYTGGSTLAAAQAGAEVVHIDSAKNTVGWARRNAGLSQCADAPVRWIAEDAAKFVQREVRRGNRYQGIVLDPPSYGHGPSGQVWQIEQHLPPLLEDCAAILADSPCLVLLTCHTPSFPAERLLPMVQQAFAEQLPAGWQTKELALRTRSGRQLPSGLAIRWNAAD